jgi:hypothetical protein
MAGRKKIRNFWLNIDIDGQMKQVSCGPSKPDGGLRGTIKMRLEGRPTDVLRIRARALLDGQLVLEVFAVSDEAAKLMECHNYPGVGPLLRFTTER